MRFVQHTTGLNGYQVNMGVDAINNKNTNFLVIMRIAGLMLILVFSWDIQQAIASPVFGIDQRPSNLTCIAPERPAFDAAITAERVYPNLDFPANTVFDFEQLPGDSSHWFATSREGLLYRIPTNDLTITFADIEVVLDITNHFSPVVKSLQWGINSIAFHPKFASNGKVYMIYNTQASDTDPVVSHVSMFISADGGQSFDPASEQILMSLEQSGAIHTMGNLAFGPDGFLYIGSGDGGSNVRAQNLNDLHGKLLRIDVDKGSPYAIPPDNPYAGGGGAAEIYAVGFRSPWRFSFDRETGELWLGDVGDQAWEEINLVVKGGNYGWAVVEGNSCATNQTGCDPDGFIPPVLAYPHTDGFSVIGGYVYRGNLIADFQGVYIFSDPMTRDIRALIYDSFGNLSWKVVGDSTKIVSLTEDNDGELYMVGIHRGRFVRLIPDTSSTTGANTFPQLLSETGCFDPADPTQSLPGVIPYTVNATLWSDGATKRRWMALPDGEQIQIGADGDWHFPVGSVLIKEFSSKGRPFETRLFIRHSDGDWAGYSYEWNDAGTDAKLLPAGKTKQINTDLTWTFPSPAQCLQCHTTTAGDTLGPENTQLNGDFHYPSSGLTANQLLTLDHIGLLQGGLPTAPADLQALSDISDLTRPVTLRARSYLHANCSFCHRPGGLTPAQEDFRYSVSIDAMNSCNLPPLLDDFGLLDALLLYPGNPSKSIISLRMHALDGKRMPPIGTDIVDTVAASVIDAWISAPDVCDFFPDTDGDGTTDNLDNCTAVSNASQRDSDGDGYGNRCDADLNNDLLTNSLDLGLFKLTFFTADADSDFNGDGIVNSLDLGLFEKMFFQPPGPSGLVK